MTCRFSLVERSTHEHHLRAFLPTRLQRCECRCYCPRRIEGARVVGNGSSKDEATQHSLRFRAIGR
jgi:hypothetical protein